MKLQTRLDVCLAPFEGATQTSTATRPVERSHRPHRPSVAVIWLWRGGSPHTPSRREPLHHARPKSPSAWQETSRRGPRKSSPCNAAQRAHSCESRSVEDLARGDRKWRLNDGQLPNFRGVRVHVSTGYIPPEGHRRASRYGRVISHPKSYRYDSRFFHRCSGPSPGQDAPIPQLASTITTAHSSSAPQHAAVHTRRPQERGGLSHTSTSRGSSAGGTLTSRPALSSPPSSQDCRTTLMDVSVAVTQITYPTDTGNARLRKPQN